MQMKRKLMQQIVGVTELQRKFRSFFDQVVSLTSKRPSC